MDTTKVFLCTCVGWHTKNVTARLLHDICAANPFTHAVELIRFALYGQLKLPALGWTCLAGAILMALALWGYDPARGLLRRKS